VSGRRWLLVALIAAVALAVQAVAVAAVWRYTRPKLPALAAAVPALDRAIAQVVAAAGDRAAVAVGPLVPVASCADTPLAKGSRVSRTADLYTDPGQEDALIGRIAGALPPDEHARRGIPIGGGPPPLTADLGTGLQLHVTQLGRGWIAAIAETDCRNPGRPAPAASTAPDAAVVKVLASLGTTPATWRADKVSCPGGSIVTVATISAETDTDNLRNRLADTVPATARRFVSSTNRLAWRDGRTSVVVAASDDGRHITVQDTDTGC
jgi:uncharacterized membrane protein